MRYSRTKPFLLWIFILFKITALPAQDIEDESYGITLSQDSYFGFYATVNGSFNLKEKMDFTFYADFWTNPAFGNISDGTDFWLEAGAGLSFLFLEDKLSVNPSLGFTYGKALSGGKTGVVADGFVPSVVLNYNHNQWNAQFYSAYFGALRREGPVTIDYYLYWIWGGVDLSKRIAVGLHQEYFLKARETDLGAENLYLWLGPYLQFTIAQKYQLRLTAGVDLLKSNEATDFYKLSTFIPFH